MKKILFRGALLLALLLTAALPSYAVNSQHLVPVGRAVGIDVHTDGALVIGYSQTEEPSAAEQAGILAGDMITAIDGRAIGSCADVQDALTRADGSPIPIELVRGCSHVELTVTPAKAESRYELGLWLRDGIAGIGTVTYYDPDTGEFGSLGHPITDLDTGVMVPISGGNVYASTITDVVAGQPGSPGQLVGDFEVETDIGSLRSNTDFGVFGVMDVPFDGQPVDLAEAEEVHTGPATILSNIAGSQVESYDVEISHIYSGIGGHGMMITVTDEDLLQTTGGIVQGMSGSPIVQDGKLVGAVTHVLVNDPARGYGIFIESMLDAA